MARGATLLARLRADLSERCNGRDPAEARVSSPRQLRAEFGPSPPPVSHHLPARLGSSGTYCCASTLSGEYIGAPAKLSNPIRSPVDFRARSSSGRGGQSLRSDGVIISKRWRRVCVPGLVVLGLIVSGCGGG